MNNEEIIRQEAVQLYLRGVSKQEIASQLNRSRQWVYKWIDRFEKSVETDWNKNQSNAPKTPSQKIAPSVEQTIVDIRNRLSSNPYAQKGAISILYEFERLGLTPPSISTINRVLKRNRLVHAPFVRSAQSKDYPSYFCGIQQMDLIGPRYLKGGFKFYFFTIIDIENHYAGAYPIRTKSASDISSCLVRFWHDYQLPSFLQMDNELSFRGSNRHPRGLGLLLRIAISNMVIPIFIPPAGPWRNGVIEKFNNTAQKYFYDVQVFESFEHLQKKTEDFVSFHNQNHRYSSQAYQTPNQMIRTGAPLMKWDKEIDFSKKIIIEEGNLIFIRFVRSDLKLTILNSTFILKSELMYCYVVAQIIIEKHLLLVIHNDVVYQSFPFLMPLA